MRLTVQNERTYVAGFSRLVPRDGSDWEELRVARAPSAASMTGALGAGCDKLAAEGRPDLQVGCEGGKLTVNVQNRTLCNESNLIGRKVKKGG